MLSEYWVDILFKLTQGQQDDPTPNSQQVKLSDVYTGKTMNYLSGIPLFYMILVLLQNVEAK